MMDNFEWSAGFGNRFGIAYFDFDTQKRTPKQAHSFSEKSQRKTGSCERSLTRHRGPGAGFLAD